MHSQNTNVVETKTDLFTCVSFLITNIRHKTLQILNNNIFNYLCYKYINEAYLGLDNQKS